MGNTEIKEAISRNRFQILILKMYFNESQKPADYISKTYDIDKVMNCFKHIFPKAREDSPYQSIDESMAKFKRR